MTNAELFLDKYKQLEEVVRNTYHLRDADSISYYLSGQDQYKRFKDDIKYCQDVRNLLSHKKKLNNSFAVEPNVHMIQFIDNLVNKIKNRPKCVDVQIRFNDIYWQTTDGSVKNAMTIMREKLYTHVPIIDDNGIVVGVFDENSIFTYIADEGIVSIEDELKFIDIEHYISLENREMESFVFVKANSYVEDLESEFERSLNRHQRIGMAFVTVNGKPTEKLQGIITPWDIISLNE